MGIDFEEIKKISCLEVAKRLGMDIRNSKVSCFLPGHTDRNPSCYIYPERWKCPVCDVGGDQVDMVSRFNDVSKAEAAEWLQREFGLNNQMKSKCDDFGVFEREHIYPGGQLKKVINRCTDGSKRAWWSHMENGKWVKKRPSGVPPLYPSALTLPDFFFLVEGEKDVDTWKRLGKAAVSLPDGSSSRWYPEYGDTFKNKSVYIIQDNDEPGQKYAQRMAETLNNIAASVRTLDLTKVWPDMPKHGDTTDFIEHFGDADGMKRILELAMNSEEWQPETDDPFLSCFKTLDSFSEEEATWLVPGWIPEGQITLMAADGGIGKTTMWCNIIAALSSGKRCVLDPDGYKRNPLKVAFLTTEDSVRKKLCRKLREAGATMQNVLTPDFVADKSGALRNLKFGSDDMARFVRHFKPALCVFDPVQGFIPRDLNMGSRNAMRDCMAPLISLGEEVGTTFLVVAHTNKRKGASGRDRVADSSDLWDISRSVIMAGYTEEQGVRYLSNEKNNYEQLQETVLFSIDQNGQICREGTSWKRDREYMQEAAFNVSAPKREDCKTWISAQLTSLGGSVLTKELEEKAKSAGYSMSTLRRAKDELKQDGQVKYFHTGGGKDRVWHIQLVDNFVELPDGTPTPFDELLV